MNKEMYYQNPNHCKQCNTIIPYEKMRNKFCCSSCSATYSNTRRVISQEQKDKVANTINHKIKIGEIIHKRERISKLCKVCSNPFEIRKCDSKQECCSRECYVKDPNKKGGKGGYRKGSGVGKHGWYKGYWCDSSYELAFVIYNLEHNIQFSRNKQGFEYEWEGEKHLYYPDFMIDDTFIEIKGFWTKQHDAKIKAFPHKLKVYYKSDITNILEYVITKYGTDYINLYENNPYKEKKDNVCRFCGNPCKNVFCCRSCAGKERAKIKHKKIKRPNNDTP